MAQVWGLPKCVAIQSLASQATLRYLCTLQQDGDTTAIATVSEFGELSKDDGGVTRPHARFYTEPSKKKDGLVHIRCYNNKYWVPQRQDGDSRVIVGTANEPEEDLSKLSCTLFKPVLNADGAHPNGPLNSVRFFHPHLQQYVHMTSSADKNEKRPKNFFYLEAADERTDSSTFILLDLSQHVVLPQYVAFKGDNDMYLTVEDGSPFLHFSSSEVADPKVVNTIINNNDGTVRIKSNYLGKYWWASESNYYIRPDSTDDQNINTLFKVTKVGNYFALRSMSNNCFCKRLTKDMDKLKHLLWAGIDNITYETKLLLVEPVLSREIYNTVYHGTDNPRIYGTTSLSMVSASAVNRSTTQSNSVKLSLTLKQTETRTWDSTVSHKASISTSIDAGIPMLGIGMSIGFSYEYSKSFSWGTTESKEKTQDVEFQVTVPPMKKVTVSAISRQAKCDVPFSYMQKDVLHNGEVETTYHDDGMFTGMNSFDVQYETKEEDIN